jgi:hypothetical protein
VRVGVPVADRRAQLCNPEPVLHQADFDGDALKLVYQPGVRLIDWVKVKRKGAIPAERFKRDPR